MKQVWKCDFCVETHEIKENILSHEKKCVFNPIRKTCYSCKFREYFYEIEQCSINLSIFDGSDGECKGWKPTELKQFRKFKLNKINELNK